MLTGTSREIWMTAHVASSLFLLKQIKEVNALFSCCEMEWLLSVDCIQFTEGKTGLSCVKDPDCRLSFLKKKKKNAPKVHENTESTCVTH